MSIAIKSNVNLDAYSNAVNTPPATPVNQNAQSLVEMVRNSASIIHNYDSYEAMTTDPAYRDDVISNPNVLGLDYRRYFTSGGMYSVDDATALYEKGREGILKAFSDDEELMNAHLQVFNDAFEYHFQKIAFHIALSLSFERMEAHRLENQGYVGHKLAINKDFNKEDFEANSKNMLKEYGCNFLNNIKNGLNYADAKKSTLEYMAEAFKTTSVNSLSLSDFMLIGKYMVADKGDKRATSAAEIYAQKSELNRRFNNSTELSAELRALLG